jgi:hypothetical protein
MRAAKEERAKGKAEAREKRKAEGSVNPRQNKRVKVTVSD